MLDIWRREGERTGRVSQEHNETVDTDTPSTGRRKGVLKTGERAVSFTVEPDFRGKLTHR